LSFPLSNRIGADDSEKSWSAVIQRLLTARKELLTLWKATGDSGGLPGADALIGIPR